MPDKPVSDDVRDLIQRHIDSVAQLEAFLLLQAHPANCIHAKPRNMRWFSDTFKFRTDG